MSARHPNADMQFYVANAGTTNATTARPTKRGKAKGAVSVLLLVMSFAAMLHTWPFHVLFALLAVMLYPNGRGVLQARRPAPLIMPCTTMFACVHGLFSRALCCSRRCVPLPP